MRKISIDAIKENDLIRVSGSIADMTISRVGIVASITSHMWGRTIATESGMALLDIDRDGNTGIDGLDIKLLNELPSVPLFELTGDPASGSLDLLVNPAD